MTDDELRARLHRAVRGSLRQAIVAHGPITPQLVESATKRVVGQLCAHDGAVTIALRDQMR